MKFISLTLVFLFSINVLANSGVKAFTATEDTDVKSISKFPDTKLSKFSNKTLFVFFQANCHACKLQINDLKCLEKDFDINLLGSISPVKDLKKEYKKYKTKYPAYFADPITMAYLPIDVPATPQIIIWNKKKPKGYMGYKPCQEYKKLLLAKKQ